MYRTNVDFLVHVNVSVNFLKRYYTCIINIELIKFYEEGVKRRETSNPDIFTCKNIVKVTV